MNSFKTLKKALPLVLLVSCAAQAMDIMDTSVGAPAVQEVAQEVVKPGMLSRVYNSVTSYPYANTVRSAGSSVISKVKSVPGAARSAGSYVVNAAYSHPKTAIATVAVPVAAGLGYVTYKYVPFGKIAQIEYKKNAKAALDYTKNKASDAKQVVVNNPRKSAGVATGVATTAGLAVTAYAKPELAKQAIELTKNGLQVSYEFTKNNAGLVATYAMPVAVAGLGVYALGKTYGSSLVTYAKANKAKAAALTAGAAGLVAAGCLAYKNLDVLADKTAVAYAACAQGFNKAFAYVASKMPTVTMPKISMPTVQLPKVNMPTVTVPEITSQQVVAGSAVVVAGSAATIAYNQSKSQPVNPNYIK